MRRHDGACSVAGGQQRSRVLAGCSAATCNSAARLQQCGSHTTCNLFHESWAVAETCHIRRAGSNHAHKRISRVDGHAELGGLRFCWRRRLTCVPVGGSQAFSRGDHADSADGGPQLFFRTHERWGRPPTFVRLFFLVLRFRVMVLGLPWGQHPTRNVHAQVAACAAACA